MFPTLTRDDVYRIETPRLWLRWPRLDDAGALAAWAGRAEVATMTSTWKVGITAAEAAERLATSRQANANGNGLVLVLTPKGEDANPIGIVGIVGTVADRCATLELGYHLDPAHWARGLMTEAVRAIVAQAFELTGSERIVAATRPDNHGSIKVLKRSGFVSVGGGEHESPLYGRYIVRHFALARQKPSSFAEARRRFGGGAPKTLAPDVAEPV